MSYVYVFIGGGLGSLSRYLIGKLSNQIVTSSFPIGTLVTNILACILLALLVVSFSPKSSEFAWVQPLLIVGFCGGFSTFSTFGNETFQLMDSGNYGLAILNVLISVVVGVGLIFFIRYKLS